MPAMEAAGVDLAGRMLCYTPAARITAKASLDHPYFADLDRSIIGTKALPEQPRAARRGREREREREAPPPRRARARRRTSAQFISGLRVI